MRKMVTIPFLLFLLSGCSLGNVDTQVNKDQKNKEEKVESKQQENNQNEKKTSENKEPIDNKDVYVPNPQITDDLHLVQVGKTVSDAKGELTLKAYKKVNKTMKVGPIEMLIKDAKIMHYRPDYSMIDFFHGYTHDEEFDFVKVSVEIKNPSSDTVKFTPIAAVQTDRGEHKTWEDDIYLEELGGEIVQNDLKKGSIGFILEDIKDIKSLEVLSSDVVNLNNKVIEEGKKSKIDF